MTVMSGRRAPRAAVAAVVLAVGLVTTGGCTQGSGSTTSAQPSAPTAASTPSQAPTEPAALSLREPASFRLRTGPGHSSAVAMTVTRVTRGRTRDLSRFALDAVGRRSIPYYATVRVTQTGRGDLAGARVTLWGVDADDTVRPPATVVGPFRRCRPQPLPADFGRGDSARTCLIYLVPRGTALDAVQYRFNDARPPFSWSVR